MEDFSHNLVFGDWLDQYKNYISKEAAKRGIGVIVSQSPTKYPIPTEVIAQAVADIADGVKKINAGNLNRKGLLILLSHASGVPQRECKKVIDSLGDLGKRYLKP